MTYDSSLEELVRGPETCTFQQCTFYVPAVTHTVDILNHIDISKSQWHLFNNYVILCTLKFFKAVAPLLLSCVREMRVSDLLTCEGPVCYVRVLYHVTKLNMSDTLLLSVSLLCCWQAASAFKKILYF